MNKTNAPSDDFESVTAIIQAYFNGLHNGDVPKLKSIFHQDAWLKAPGVRRSLEQWLESVANRPVPAQEGKSFNYKILSIDIVHDQAMVKVECPLFEFDYIDFLGLLKEQGQWLIVNKMYADTKSEILS